MEREIPIRVLCKEELMKWLKNLGSSVTGTKEELLTRIKKYQRYPNLIKKLKIAASPVLIYSTLNIKPSTKSTANWKVEHSGTSLN